MIPISQYRFQSARAFLAIAITFFYFFSTSSAYAAKAWTITASNLVFGVYDYLDTPTLDIATNVTIQVSGCEKNDRVNYRITLSAGQGSLGARILANGANSLNYNLFIDSARSQIWGDGTADSSFIAVNLTCSSSYSETHTIYGRIFPAPNGVPGSYSDPVITVTLTHNK